MHRNTCENKNNSLYEIINKRILKKIKSLDNIILNCKNIRKKKFSIGFINIEKNKKRKSSYIFDKNEIIEQLRFNFE